MAVRLQIATGQNNWVDFYSDSDVSECMRLLERFRLRFADRRFRLLAGGHDDHNASMNCKVMRPAGGNGAAVVIRI
jgi:hypothetical protein